jgi:hypothetical protein
MKYSSYAFKWMKICYRTKSTKTELLTEYAKENRIGIITVIFTYSKRDCLAVPLHRIGSSYV